MTQLYLPGIDLKMLKQTTDRSYGETKDKLKTLTDEELLSGIATMSHDASHIVDIYVVAMASAICTSDDLNPGFQGGVRRAFTAVLPHALTSLVVLNVLVRDAERREIDPPRRTLNISEYVNVDGGRLLLPKTDRSGFGENLGVVREIAFNMAKKTNDMIANLFQA